MKKIINGKKYNTETAKEVAYWDNGLYRDHGYCEETLYCKRTGEFFLYGKSGPAGKYSYMVSQNCWSGGSDIVPLTEDEVRTWAERKLDVDEYEAIFGEVEE